MKKSVKRAVVAMNKYWFPPIHQSPLRFAGGPPLAAALSPYVGWLLKTVSVKTHSSSRPDSKSKSTISDELFFCFRFDIFLLLLISMIIIFMYCSMSIIIIIISALNHSNHHISTMIIIIIAIIIIFANCSISL